MIHRAYMPQKVIQIFLAGGWPDGRTASYVVLKNSVLAEIKFKCRGAFACSQDKNRIHHFFVSSRLKIQFPSHPSKGILRPAVQCPSLHLPDCKSNKAIFKKIIFSNLFLCPSHAEASHAAHLCILQSFDHPTFDNPTFDNRTALIPASCRSISAADF